MNHEKINNKNILVTGGAGFIASHIVDKLVAKNHNVSVIDNLCEGKISNLDKSINKIQFIDGSICDEKLVKNTLKDIDIVFHFAGNANVPKSVDEPKYDFDNNIYGTFVLLDSIRKHNTKCNVVFASTAGVYGPPVNIPMQESDLPNPISPYGASKLACEKIGLAYNHCYGINFLPVRIFNSFGPRQPRYVIYDLLQKLKLNNKTLTVLGTGQEIRDYTYVDKTSEMIINLGMMDEIYSQPINICSGMPIKIKDLVKNILDAINFHDTEVKYTGQSWPGDVKVLHGDNSILKTFINFSYSKEDLQKGIIEIAKEIELI